jgi:integrase
MGPHIEGFRAKLLGSAYTPGTIANVLRETGRLGRWMAEVDIEAAQLDWDAIEAFREARPVRGARRAPGARAFRPLMDYLQDQGVLAERASQPTPVDELVATYHAWLVGRGLAEQTVLRYERLARRFLTERSEVAGSRFVDDLCGVDVVAFLLRECRRASVGTAKGRVAELRSLLRFLYLRELTPTPLAVAVPPVAGWRETSLPAGPGPADVQRLLDSCDPDDAGGARDLAILMLVARLGLRSIEVSRLELDDIDWRAGEIVVRGKARRRDRLPLPWEAGTALATYICQARPPTPLRQVFLACKAPRRPIRAALVSEVTRRACGRAGLERFGAHALRHALATEILRCGGTLVEVSQVLRHQDLATTAIYAKVDNLALGAVAKPWPGAAK